MKGFLLAAGIASLWATSAVAAPCAPGELTRVGKGMETPVSQSGQQEPLLVALRLILPADQGWKVDNSRRVSSVNVFWSEGQSWTSAVSEVLRQANACAEVDFQTRLVTLQGVPPLPEKPTITALPPDEISVTEELDRAEALAKPQPAPVATPPKAIPPVSAPPAPKGPRAQGPQPVEDLVSAPPIVVPPPAPAKPAPLPPAPATPHPKTTIATGRPAPVAPPAAPKVHSVVGVAPAPLDDAPPPEVLIAGLRGDTLAAINADVTGWELRAGDTLRRNLDRWSRDAAYQLVWRSEVDYPVDAGIVFPEGTSFEEAVRQTIRSFWVRSTPLKATIYKNRVIVITGE